MIGPFLTGLRDGRILGAGAATGCCARRWSTTPRPVSRSSPSSSRSGRAARSGRGRGSPQPTPKHPFDHPFAFALIRLDGADTPIAHAVDAGSIEAMRRACASRRSTARSATARSPTSTSCPRPTRVLRTSPPARSRWRSPSTSIVAADQRAALPAPGPLCAGPARGAHHRSALAGERQGVRPEQRLRQPRARRDDRGRRRRGGRPRRRELVHRHHARCSTTARRRPSPYIRASVLLDGADPPIAGVDIRDIPVRRVPRRHARARRVEVARRRDVSDLGNRCGGRGRACIERWEPTGEPDVDPRPLQEFAFLTRRPRGRHCATSQTSSYRRFDDPSRSSSCAA